MALVIQMAWMRRATIEIAVYKDGQKVYNVRAARHTTKEAVEYVHGLLETYDDPSVEIQDCIKHPPVFYTREEFLEKFPPKAGPHPS
jgi:hypothetical protein